MKNCALIIALALFLLLVVHLNRREGMTDEQRKLCAENPDIAAARPELCQY
jgi:hypothetical protein